MAKLVDMAAISGCSGIPDRYSELATERSTYLTQGQEYSRMTLPYLLPESMTRGSDANQHGFQSHGAKLVNHLSNKLALTLFPPQRSFFGISLGEEASEALAAIGVGESDISRQVVSITHRAEKLGAKLGLRTGLIEGFKQLVVSGNVALHLPNKGGMQAIPLDRYVVKRSLVGDVQEFITYQEKSFSAFSKSMKAKLKASKGGKNFKGNEKIKLYTRAVWCETEDKWKVDQSADDIPIGEVSRVKSSKLPWIILRWNTAYGEDYGRGLCEDQAGYLHLLDYLSEAMTKGMVLMADIKYLVRPGSTTSPEELMETPTGEFISGNRDDIGVLQLEKYANFDTIMGALNDVKRELGQAFMMNSANRRDAERVTTYELRLDANEMETSLGGIYSQFSQTLQPALAILLLDRVNPKLVDIVEPNILTGIDALGRVGDLDKIMQFSEMMTIPNNWPDDVRARMQWDKYISKVTEAISMESEWLMTEEEFKEAQGEQRSEQQQEMMLAQASKAIPGVIEQQVQER